MNEYNLAKSEDGKRLPNIDVEMSSVKGNRGIEAEKMLSDTDDVDVEEPMLNEQNCSDEDEQTNTTESKKALCSKFRVVRLVQACDK